MPTCGQQLAQCGLALPAHRYHVEQFHILAILFVFLQIALDGFVGKHVACRGIHLFVASHQEHCGTKDSKLVEIFHKHINNKALIIPIIDSTSH